MTTKDLINVKQFVTDSEGHKTAVIIDIEDFNKLDEILEAIPKSEEWLYENKEALASVRQGLKDAADGKTSKLGIEAL